MTVAYITAGLGVQDTSTAPAAATAAHLTAGLAAAEMPHTGYHLYVTRGGLADADFEAAPAMVIPEGRSSGIFIGGDFAPSERYTLVLRPVIDDVETPDLSCRFEFETDSGGQWPGRRPGSVEAVSVELLSAGRAVVSWTYRTCEGEVSPEDFGVYYASAPQILPGAPQAAVGYERDGVYSRTLSLAGGQTYFFGVTARSAGGVESQVSPVVGPVVADTSAPMQPPVILTTIF